MTRRNASAECALQELMGDLDLPASGESYVSTQRGCNSAVECDLAKVDVGGSIPPTRSKKILEGGTYGPPLDTVVIEPPEFGRAWPRYCERG